MNNNQLGNELCKAIAKINPLDLNYLSLESNKITEEGFRLLTECEFRGLTHLYFANNLLGDNLSFKQDHWKNITFLSLTNNRITSKGLPKFSVYFPTLQSLSLKLNPINNEGLLELLKDTLPSLEYLHLESCQLTNTQEFPEQRSELSERFPRLSKIYLNGNNINTDALQNLIKCSLTPRLLILNL